MNIAGCIPKLLKTIALTSDGNMNHAVHVVK